jgi:hypothetical protein
MHACVYVCTRVCVCVCACERACLESAVIVKVSIAVGRSVLLPKTGGVERACAGGPPPSRPALLRAPTGLGIEAIARLCVLEHIQ